MIVGNFPSLRKVKNHIEIQKTALNYFKTAMLAHMVSREENATYWFGLRRSTDNHINRRVIGFDSDIKQSMQCSNTNIMAGNTVKTVTKNTKRSKLPT